MTQNEALLNAMKRGRVLTAMRALREFRCARLAARVYELRERGVNIHSTLVNKGGKKYAAYWIPT
jgi:predicted transcriptional regulator